MRILLVILLVTMSLGLSGCNKEEKKPPINFTPPASGPNRDLLPDSFQK